MHIVLDIYRWHSINIVPAAATVTVVTDERPHDVVGRRYELTLLGVVFALEVPATTRKKAWTSSLSGPRWSRRNKVWKWGWNDD
jgi:hypothetical protein